MPTSYMLKRKYGWVFTLKKTIILVLFSFSFFLSFASFVGACSCAENPSVEIALERSDAVFSGEVVNVKEVRNPQGYMSKSVLFEVFQSWKGVEQSQLIIATGLGGGDCGFDFQVGKHYLVYATESSMYGGESLAAIICSRTKALSSVQGDLSILGEGKAPTVENYF